MLLMLFLMLNAVSMNALRLQQDHPCVIEIIRKHFLLAPSPPHVPYVLTVPEEHKWPYPTDGQTALILRRLDYKVHTHTYNLTCHSLAHYNSLMIIFTVVVIMLQVGGFFVEAGAHNGEHLSNTLYMERVLDWTGILIEPSPENFRNLTTKNRKSFALNVCLSPKPYPIRVEFNAFLGAGGINRELGSRADDEDAAEAAQFKQIRSEDGHWNLVQSQCFPLYSILLAVNQTTVDYLSLDVEGHEIKILETIPWHKIRLNSMSVEWLRIPGEFTALRRFMDSHQAANNLTLFDGYMYDFLYAKAK